ncbi:MAG: TrmJ/YjtD family RNA methyltransferase [Promethearchaeota archaeon]
MGNSSDVARRTHVLLVGVESPGNVGSVARVAKNFGVTRLILFNPRCEITDETYGFAMHAADVVGKAVVVPEGGTSLERLLSEFDVVVGFTARAGQYRQIVRQVVPLPQFELPPLGPSQRLLLVFGRESRGLTLEELDLLDFLVHVPTSPLYLSMNLSHAVGVVLYELFSRRAPWVKEGVHVASYRDRQRLYEALREVVVESGVRRHKVTNVVRAVKNAWNRAYLTRKECKLILSWLRRTRQILMGRNTGGRAAPRG